MNGVTDAVFTSWDFNPGLLFTTLVTALVYTCGSSQLRRRAPHRFGLSHLLSFYAGLSTILLALISPLHAFAGWLLTVHMIQHLLLMMVAPPLILYGAPYMPLLFGLPKSVLRDGVGRLLTSLILRKIGRFVSHPTSCWFAFVLTSITWHAPPMYELALRNSAFHELEHLSFLITALLFWWPIIQPWPWVASTPRWMAIPYLFLADFQNTALSAFLIFYERVLYPSYQGAPRICEMTPLEDQAAAGAIMWVVGSLFFLVPVGLITIEVLSASRVAVGRYRKRISLPESSRLLLLTPQKRA